MPQLPEFNHKLFIVFSFVLLAAYVTAVSVVIIVVVVKGKSTWIYLYVS